MYLVSACLCGINCKYSGKNNLNEKVLDLFNKGLALPVCPEVLGGLTTPREPAEIAGGSGKDVFGGKAKVISKIGEDNTEAFIKGAEQVLEIAEKMSVKTAILKANSPSCGYGQIYDGTFSGEKILGNGVTAELLKKNGIEVVTEFDL